MNGDIHLPKVWELLKNPHGVQRWDFIVVQAPGKDRKRQTEWMWVCVCRVCVWGGVQVESEFNNLAVGTWVITCKKTEKKKGYNESKVITKYMQSMCTPWFLFNILDQSVIWMLFMCCIDFRPFATEEIILFIASEAKKADFIHEMQF